jgi:uncharacterized membrane protein YedE/YeeE
MFMAAGFLTSTYMRTAHSLGVVDVNMSPKALTTEFPFEYQVAAASLVSLAVCALAARCRPIVPLFPLVFEVVCGFTFGCGLVISGMTSPAKVASFLTASPQLFDPTLMFVMAGGIAVALPGFQFMMRQQATNPRLFSFLERKIDIPSNKVIDLKLAIGALMFGTGWGLLGICPGPAIVSLATLQPRVLVFGATYAASFAFFEFVLPLLPKRVFVKSA